MVPPVNSATTVRAAARGRRPPAAGRRGGAVHPHSTLPPFTFSTSP
jgi:hypothetical protein